VTIETTLVTLADSTLIVYNADGDKIDEYDDGGVDLACKLNVTPEEDGYFYIRVSAYESTQLAAMT